MPTEQLGLGETEAEAKAGAKRPGLTTDEVKERLRARHAWPEWLFHTEVPFAGPDGRDRLADAVAVPTYASRGYVIHGFEVKVTRSDWLRELKDHAKAEAVARHVDRFWLVLGDAKIIDGPEEVPPDWGIMVPRGDGLRALRQAKPLRDEKGPLDRRFLVTLARKANKAAYKRHEDRQREAYEHGYKAGRSAGLAHGGQAPEKARAFDALADALDLGYFTGPNDPQLKRIKEFHDAGKAVLQASWRGLDGIPDQLRRVAKDLVEDANRLATAIKERGP